MSASWQIVTRSADETQNVAERLAPHLSGGDVIWLSGNLGAGKTTFTQGLGRGLHIREPIISPTFVLIREYQGRLPLYHIDLYRLETLREIDNLGLRDYLDADGVCVVEWAERYDEPGRLPGLHVHVESRGEQTRGLTFAAAGERAAQVLNAFSEELKREM